MWPTFTHRPCPYIVWSTGIRYRGHSTPLHTTLIRSFLLCPVGLKNPSIDEMEDVVWVDQLTISCLSTADYQQLIINSWLSTADGRWWIQLQGRWFTCQLTICVVNVIVLLTSIQRMTSGCWFWNILNKNEFIFFPVYGLRFVDFLEHETQWKSQREYFRESLAVLNSTRLNRLPSGSEIGTWIWKAAHFHRVDVGNYSKTAT